MPKEGLIRQRMGDLVELGFTKRENLDRYGRRAFEPSHYVGKRPEREPIGLCRGHTGGLGILIPQNKKPIKVSSKQTGR